MIKFNSSPPETKWPPFWLMIFSDAFSWMKRFVFWLKFHFLGTADIWVHVVHKSCVIISYTLESLWLNNISENERRCYICKISHCLILVWNIWNADDCHSGVCNMVSYWIKIYQESTASVNSLAPGKLMAELSLVNLPLDECHSTLLMISQHWFR